MELCWEQNWVSSVGASNSVVVARFCWSCRMFGCRLICWRGAVDVSVALQLLAWRFRCRRGALGVGVAV